MCTMLEGDYLEGLKKGTIFIISLFLFLIVIFNIYYLFNAAILKKQLATFGNQVVLEVNDTAMEPSIRKGDLVVANTNDYDYNIGDLVVFNNGNSFIVSRIITISKNEVITKDDNNSNVNKPIAREKIIGKFAFRVGFLGAIFKTLKNTSASIILFALGVVICLILKADDYDKETKKKEIEEERLFEEKILKKN